MTIELDPSKVSPQTHVFLGMYRPPLEKVQDDQRRTCGIQYPDGYRAIREHWLAGHFDIPQYRVIEDAKPERPKDSIAGVIRYIDGELSFPRVRKEMYVAGHESIMKQIRDRLAALSTTP